MVSPVFTFLTLQPSKCGAFSPKFCSAASVGAWLTLRPSKSPEGHVTSAAGGVTTKHFPRHGILLMQKGGLWASPMPTPPTPPATAWASHKLCLYKAFCFRKRQTTATSPFCSIFNISKVWGVQNPHFCGGAGSTPTACPLLENNGLAPLPNWVKVSLIHDCDGYWRTSKKLGSSVWAFVKAGGRGKVAQPNR